MEIKAAGQYIPIKPEKSQKNDEQYIPDPYKKVAKGMESQFAQFMLEQMQKTVHKNDPESSAERYYNSLLTQKRANKLSERGGLGIQEMILNQVYPTRLRNKITYEAYKQQQASLIGSKKNINIAPASEIEMKGKESL